MGRQIRAQARSGLNRVWKFRRMRRGQSDHRRLGLYLLLGHMHANRRMRAKQFARSFQGLLNLRAGLLFTAAPRLKVALQRFPKPLETG